MRGIDCRKTVGAPSFFLFSYAGRISDVSEDWRETCRKEAAGFMDWCNYLRKAS